MSVNVEHLLGPARAFYADVFELPSKSRPTIPGIDGHWFALGDAELHLVDAPAGVSAIRPAGNHFCVAVDDLEAAIAELDERRIEYARGAQGDVVQIWFVDPAGNTVELQQDRELPDAHGNLEDVVQHREPNRHGHDEPTPHRRLGLVEGE